MLQQHIHIIKSFEFQPRLFKNPPFYAKASQCATFTIVMLPSSGHLLELRLFCHLKIVKRPKAPVRQVFFFRRLISEIPLQISLHAYWSIFTLSLSPALLEKSFQMCQSHLVSQNRISLHLLLSKNEKMCLHGKCHQNVDCLPLFSHVVCL